MGWELQEYIFIFIIKERERERPGLMGVAGPFGCHDHSPSWSILSNDVGRCISFAPALRCLFCVFDRELRWSITADGPRSVHPGHNNVTDVDDDPLYNMNLLFHSKYLCISRLLYFYLSIFLFSNGWKGFARSYRKNKVDSKAKNNTGRNE